MKEPIILPIKPGALSRADKKALSDAGVIVIEHINPEEIRLLRPIADLDSSELLRCAVHAINNSGSQYLAVDFKNEICKAILEKK